jgi:hypothetical protein
VENPESFKTPDEPSAADQRDDLSSFAKSFLFGSKEHTLEAPAKHELRFKVD